jgi:hypothetical protein
VLGCIEANCFSSVLQDFLYLQELRTFAPLQIQNVREGAQLFSQRMNKYLPHFAKFDDYSSDVGHIL